MEEDLLQKKTLNGKKTFSGMEWGYTSTNVLGFCNLQGTGIFLTDDFSKTSKITNHQYLHLEIKIEKFNTTFEVTENFCFWPPGRDMCVFIHSPIWVCTLLMEVPGTPIYSSLN